MRDSDLSFLLSADTESLLIRLRLLGSASLFDGETLPPPRSKTLDRLTKLGLVTREHPTGEITLTPPGDEVSYYVQERWLQRNSSFHSDLFSRLGLNRMSSARILDCGCGTATLLWNCLRSFPSCTAVGIDMSRVALQIAKHDLTESDLQSRALLECGDVYQLPHPEEAFEVVIDNGLIESVVISRAFAEYSRVLVKGGLLYARCHGFGYYLSLLLNPRRWRQARKHSFALFNGLWFAAAGNQVSLLPSWGKHIAYSRRALGTSLRRQGLRLVAFDPFIPQLPEDLPGPAWSPVLRIGPWSLPKSFDLIAERM